MIANMVSPSFFLQLCRMRAEREARTQAFHDRRKAALIAREAVNEQGVGE